MSNESTVKYSSIGPVRRDTFIYDETKEFNKEWEFPGEKQPVLRYGPRIAEYRDQVRTVGDPVRVDSVAQPALGILGSAALLNPALAVPAAAAGIGYGVYKLGNTFKLW